MTREEAIRVLDPKTTSEALAEIEYYHGFNGGQAKTLAVMEACEMAISALREQEERSKGCEYCDGTETDLYFHEGACQQMNDLVYLSGNSLVCDFGCKVYASIEIKFCPMCGRKLEVEG